MRKCVLRVAKIRDCLSFLCVSFERPAGHHNKNSARGERMNCPDFKAAFIRIGLATLLSTTAMQVVGQPEFPTPKGNFPVGRIDIEVLDQSRNEIFTEDESDKRRLLASVYYPASVQDGTAHTTYVPEYLMTALNFSTEQRAWPSVGYADVPISDGAYPVLMFSSGMGNMPFLYSSLLYDIASDGYVVVAIWHPYSVGTTAFPDGEVLRINETGVPAEVETLEQSLMELERIGVVWVADILKVADELEVWNGSHPLLQGHLDLERLGAFGHSFGGAASAQAAYQDDRIDAVINMDGTMFGNVATAGSKVPLLVLESDAPPPTDEMLSEAGITREELAAEKKILADSLNETLRLSKKSSSHTLEHGRHNAYMTDQLFISADLPPEQRSQRIGDIEPVAAYQQIRSWVSEFMVLHVQ